jgi:hypothetical protein
MIILVNETGELTDKSPVLRGAESTLFAKEGHVELIELREVK